jgi:hypothetical protein
MTPENNPSDLSKEVDRQQQRIDELDGVSDRVIRSDPSLEAENTRLFIVKTDELQRHIQNGGEAVKKEMDVYLKAPEL